MKRLLEQRNENKLVKSALWLEKIKPDCRMQKVFFTVRDNRIDLYHKGGLLYKFSGSQFKTHIKYASVIDTDNDHQNYLSQSALESLELTPNFLTGYDRIKENCSKYSGVEAQGVSDLYHKFSYISESDIVVLDIEVSFDSLESSDNEKDRIDILLFNKNTKTLGFVEAKHFSNSALWSTVQPAVVGQIKRYEDQLFESQDAILLEYAEYIRTVNRLFDLNLPEPEAVDPKVTLFIFGFDDDQKKGRLKNCIIEDDRFSGIKSYQKGKFSKFNMKALWGAKIL